MTDHLRALLREVPETLLLAGPVVAGLLAQNSMTFIDTVMVGQLGGGALAGAALGSTVYSFVNVLCMGVVVAVGPMASQAFGAGKPTESGRAARQGIWLAVALAIPFMLFLASVSPLLLWMGQDPATVELAKGYLRAVLWGLPATLAFIALRSFVEAVSRPWPVTFITFLGVGLNLFGDYVLIFGKFGLPAMGVPGAGVATSVTYWVMLLLLVVFIATRARFRPYQVFVGATRPDPHYFRELFRIGWPIGITHGVEVGLFVVTALMMGYISTTALAAHQIAMQCASLTFMVPLGVGIATSVRVGQAAGRMDSQGVRRAGFVGIAMGACFMCLTALVFLTLPHPIIALYLDTTDPENAAVVHLAVTLLGIAGVFQVFDGIQVSSNGALRGLKDTRMPMIIGFIAYWFVGLGTGIVLAFARGLGAIGLWWGLVLGLASAAILLSTRFLRRSKNLH